MASLIRLCAITATLIVALSFILFAVDRLSDASANQVEAVQGDRARAPADAEIDQPSPSPAVERVREQSHSSVRELIDDANDMLLSPFTGLVDSDEIWVQRLAPGVPALLLYGLGGLMLARSLPRPATRTGGDWRAPAA